MMHLEVIILIGNDFSYIFKEFGNNAQPVKQVITIQSPTVDEKLPKLPAFSQLSNAEKVLSSFFFLRFIVPGTKINSNNDTREC